MDGALRQYGVFNENGLVEIPASLSYREGATLPCAALTAWNALYGGDRCLKPGETVVTLGTGGVSLFAVQFAKAGGAQVISTTSGHGKKESILRSMGVKDVINYKENKEWGKTAKKLSLGGRGADFVLEIGGMAQFCHFGFLKPRYDEATNESKNRTQHHGAIMRCCSNRWCRSLNWDSRWEI